MNCDTRQQSGTPRLFRGPFPPLRHAGPHDGDDEDEDGRDGDPDDSSDEDCAEDEEEERAPLHIDEEPDDTEDNFPPWRHIPGFERDI